MLIEHDVLNLVEVVAQPPGSLDRPKRTVLLAALADCEEGTRRNDSENGKHGYDSTGFARCFLSQGASLSVNAARAKTGSPG
ncbi:hypothetical protein [Paraburkholderia atlantica]|uniref:hypothetical protein n=1 Tax=Paraburkholderia atlantica TaxID=2654982 RepID=UPI0017FB8E60|nr:hypothetical protein [Paraburkholderia atlantica]MBB5418894.1 hypothetical protein [Paraburkholderia atlantica]